MRPHLSISFAALVLSFFVATATHAQSTLVSQNCDLSIFGEKDTVAFLTFDRELRNAVKTSNRSKIALLVEYPLRINNDNGSYYIHDAASLDRNFDNIFTSRIKRAITGSPLAALACLASGIEYGDGDVWVDDASYGYAIRAINLSKSKAMPEAGRKVFVCRTEKYRVLVDVGPDGEPRYRAWTKPHSLNDKPDAEISHGKREVEGTGYCAHTVWIFSGNEAKYVVSELGCFPDSNQPPPTATGQLSMMMGKQEDWWWCY